MQPGTLYAQIYLLRCTTLCTYLFDIKNVMYGIEDIVTELCIYTMYIIKYKIDSCFMFYVVYLYNMFLCM